MIIHIVQKGDTLFEIANQYGVDFEELVRLNSQLSSPDMIMPGMKIKVPGESKQVPKSDDKAKAITPVKADQLRDEATSVSPTLKVERSPSQDKSVKKEVRPTIESKRLDTPPKPIERPIGKELADDLVKHKKIVPKEVYPVRPIIVPPKMPKRINYAEMPEQVRGVQSDKEPPHMMPERTEVHTRPMREPLPVHQAKNQSTQKYYPMTEQMPSACHCCVCCSCRRGFMQGCHCPPRHQQRGAQYNYQPSPYNQNNPYYYQPGNRIY